MLLVQTSDGQTKWHHINFVKAVESCFFFFLKKVLALHPSSVFKDVLIFKFIGVTLPRFNGACGGYIVGSKCPPKVNECEGVVNIGLEISSMKGVRVFSLGKCGAPLLSSAVEQEGPLVWHQIPLAFLTLLVFLLEAV